MKMPLLIFPHSWLPTLRWLLKPILRPICRNLQHGSRPRITEFGATSDGVVFRSIDWMEISTYNTIPWKYVDTLVVMIDKLREERKGL